jgi:hypothetical protein
MGSRGPDAFKLDYLTRLGKEPVERGLQRILSQIPTTFGCLVYLASLRDKVAGRYSHTIFQGVLDADEADRALCNAHHQVFFRWLTFGLEEQMKDLGDYLQANGPSEAILRYADLMPSTSRDVERQLFLTDLETILELMQHGPGGGYPWRKSSSLPPLGR